MTSNDKHLILQARAFAKVFIKEADRALAGQPSDMLKAADQLAAALNDLQGVALCASTSRG